MNVHFLKSRDCFFKSLFNQSRFFEIRFNDRGFLAGDLVIFEEVFPPDYLVPNIYDPRTVPRCAAASILSVFESLPGLSPGFCVLSLAFLGEIVPGVSVPDEDPPAFVDNSYYDKGGIPVIDVLFAKLTAPQFEGFLLGNAIKYALRLNWKTISDGPGSASPDDARKLWRYSAWLSRLLEFGRDSFEASLSASPPPPGPRSSAVN